MTALDEAQRLVVRPEVAGDDEDWPCFGYDLTATCGRALRQASIPGFLSRMSVKRCSRCCDRLGYPRGVGSPKNDDACRPLVKARLASLEATA